MFRHNVSLNMLELIANGAKFYTKEIQGKKYAYMKHQDKEKFLGRVGEEE